MPKNPTEGPGWALVREGDEKPSGLRNPRSPKPKIKLEKRNGKLVTVITGLHTYVNERLNAIAKELKIRLGTGGTVKEGAIEIQGDKVAQAKSFLESKGI